LIRTPPAAILLDERRERACAWPSVGWDCNFFGGDGPRGGGGIGAMRSG
jgi:hypothetical protein